jgi:hypothetical protein
MSEFTKEEMARINIKENENRKRAVENSKKHDAEVIQNLKDRFVSPMVAPAPQGAMPTSANPAPGMKKGGAVKKFRHHDGIAQKGKTRA